MPALTKQAFCACCGERMESGEQFRWVAKQVASGSKMGSHRTTHRPAHSDRFCGARQFAREQLGQEIADLERTISAIESMPGCEIAVEILRGQIGTARSRLDQVAGW